MDCASHVKWQIHEVDFLIDNFYKMRIADIGAQLGRSEKSVGKKSQSLGLHKNKQAKNKKASYKWRAYPIAKRIGRLVIQSDPFLKTEGNVNRSYVKTLCDCGTEKDIKLSDLKSERVQSCGCFKEENQSNRVRKEPGRATLVNVYCQYKSGARRRNLEFQLSLLEVKELIEKACHYCGLPAPEWNMYTWKSRAKLLKPQQKITVDQATIKRNGIDRIDSSLGYYLDNCVPCCEHCNTAKLDYTYEEFKAYINRLVNFHSSKNAS